MNALLCALLLAVAPLPVQWAPRLDGGPIRALFVAPAFGARDVDELALRLHMKHETVVVAASGQPDEQVLQKVREALAKDFDVLVTGNIDLSVFPEDILSTIQQKTAAGRGLVLANHRDNVPPPLRDFLDKKQTDDTAADITRGVGASMTTEWPSNLDFVMAGLAEKGRVVELDYAGPKPATHFLLPGLTDPLRARPEYADVYYSLLARAVRWAAGRRPAVAVEAVDDATPPGPADEQIPPDMPEEYVQQIKDSVARHLFRPYLVRLAAPADRPYRVYAQVRESSRAVRAEYPDLPPLQKGSRDYLLELPIGPGRYFLDLWFYDKKDVVEWHTANITVAGWPEITDVNWSKGNLLPNDRLLVSFNVRPHFNRPRPCTAYARATDALDRIVAESSVPVDAAGGPVQLALNFADLLSNFAKVELFVADVETTPLSQWDMDHAAYSHIYMPVRSPAGGVCTVIAEAPAVAEYNARARLRDLADAGVDSIYTASSEDARFHLAELNLRPVPDLMLAAADADPAQEAQNPWRDAVPAQWATGAVLYSLGRAAQFTPGLAASRQTVRAIDAEAMVGVRVTPEADAPPDWHALATQLDYVAVPDDTVALCKLRSYRGAGSVAALVVEGAPAGWHVWRQAAFQMQGVWLARPFAGDLANFSGAVAELRSGVGFLLQKSVRKPEVAILDTPGVLDAQSGMVKFLQSNGYSFDFITPEMASEGQIYRYKVLLTTAELPEGLDVITNDFKSRGGRVAAFSGAADLSGVEPAVKLAGSPDNGLSAEAMTFGQAQLYTFASDPAAAPKKMKVAFNPGSGIHVYDVRLGKYLGRGKTSVKLPRGGAAVLAGLPYEVEAVEVTTLEAVRAGRRLPFSAVVKTKSGATPGPHVLHIEFGPLGEPPLRHYAQDIVCQNGQGATFIPLALNEAPGTYTLYVRDVLTAVSTEKRILIEAL